MMKELKPEDLYRHCDPELFDFETTSELEDPEGILGQPRAVAAVEFGVGMESDGYNIFAFGPTGVGKHEAIKRYLEKRASGERCPPDLCYVNNFEDPRNPQLLLLPAGRGRELRESLDELIQDLIGALASAFESEEYQARLQVIESAFEERQGTAVTELGEEAQEKGIALLRTPTGMVFAPLKGEEVLSTEEFKELSEEDQGRLKGEIERFQDELHKIFRHLPAWKREKRNQVRELNEGVSRLAVGPIFEELKQRFVGLDDVLAYLDLVEDDVRTSSTALVAREEPKLEDRLESLSQAQELEKPLLRRYRVNLLVDHGQSRGAPVVFEPNPTYQNLIGRVENISHLGALVTDFNLIRPGALHRANGGYLLLEASKLLLSPYAWEGLKRALRSKRVKIESLGEALSLASTYSLEPDPVPLATKIVLVGEPRLYYLLSSHEPDFGKLFKVAADFAGDLDRGPENEHSYARLIASLAGEEQLKPFDRGAVARVIEHGARCLGDSVKLDLNLGKLLDLLREADYWAGKAAREVVTAADVQEAIDAQIFRSDRLREKVRESILRETMLISTTGTAVGRVNGLSVLQLGDFAFGRPTRISARVRLGKGKVVNIEREVDLSGPAHSKGVLILAGLLGARYARETPLALSASLVFEQSYGGIDGDSASSTELYVLLSAITGIPIKQSLAVTGSVNQHGDVQAIGGANEKIEGFFDLCQARGLTGEQGVLIPASNVEHLMLRRDVVEAVAAGEFHIYPVADVDQGIEILTGIEAGARANDGGFPPDSVNGRVEKRLAEMARTARDFARKPRRSDASTAPRDSAGGDGEETGS